MKHLKRYKIFEAGGDGLPKDDDKLILLEDLSLEIKDMGFEVSINGYESYTPTYYSYDIIIKSDDTLRVYDVSKNNISGLDKMDKIIERCKELNKSCLELIKRAIENDLYLCDFYIDINSSGISSFIRFTIKDDGSPVPSSYKYNPQR